VDQAIETVDLRYYVSILQKWKLVIAIVTIVSMVTSGVISLFVLPPTYETKVTLMVTQASMQRLTQVSQDDLRSVMNSLSRLPEMTINTYVGQLSSSYFLTRVANQLKLSPELYPPTTLSRLITARAIKDTNLIEVTVSNNSPKLATDMANAVATEFIDFITENLQEQMSKSMRFLEDQATQASKDLVKANEQLRQVQVGLRGVEFLDRELKSKSAVLSEHSTALMKTRVEEEGVAAGLDMITIELARVPQYIKSRESGAIPSQEWNPVYRQLEQQLTAKKTELSEKKGYVSSRTGDEPLLYSDVVKVTLEINSLEAGIKTLEDALKNTSKYVTLETGTGSSEQILNPLWSSLTQQRTEKSVALAEKRALRSGYESSITQLTLELTDLQKALAERRTEEYRLQKEVSQLETAYSLLKEKIIQTQMQKSMNIGEANMSIVAPAIQPKQPVRPRKAMNVAVAGVLGLMVSVALAFVFEYMDYTIKTADDVSRHLGVPALGSVPVISSQRNSNGKKGGRS
jgi:polysaccharide biosynthesis transport protein